MLNKMLTDMVNKVRKHSEELIDEFSRLYGEHYIIKKFDVLLTPRLKACFNRFIHIQLKDFKFIKKGGGL